MNVFAHKVLLINVLALLFTSSIFAQQTISGTVRSDNHVLTDANVLLTPLGLGTVTDDEGEFEFRNIPEGTYELIISMVGYQRVREQVILSGNKPVNLSLTLSREDQKISEVDIMGKAINEPLMEAPMMEPVSIAPATSLVSRAEIQNQGAVTLVDAMKFIPGGFTETRGRKVKQFFSVRGQKYPYPTYSINGIWQKEFHETPYFFNSANIHEIKIVRSSSALLKSLTPLAGVIDITTRKYNKKETDINLQYGSLNSYRAGVNHGNATQKLHYSGGVNVFGTDGPTGRNGKEQIWNLNGSMDWQLSQTLELSVNLFYLGGSRQLVQPVAPADPRFMNRKEEYDPLSTLMASTVLKYRPNNRLVSELQVNFARREPRYSSENVQNGEVSRYDETDREVTFNQINSLAFGINNVLRFGLLYNHWVAPEGKRFYYGKRADVHTISGVVADQQRWGKLTLDAGFRFTREYFKEWGGFNIEGAGGKFKNADPVKNEWQSPVWQATAGFTYAFTPKSSLHFNTAGGIVTPRKGALNTNGEQLQNEKRINVDLGYLKTFHQSGSLSATLFLSSRGDALDYSGTILEMDNGDVRELYTNRDKRNYGLELAGKTPHIGEVCSFFANFTLMKGEIKGDDTWKSDDEIPSVVGNAGCNIEKSNIDFNLYLHYTGPFKNDRFVSKAYLNEHGKMDLGDFATMDVTSGYTFNNKLKTRVFAEARNLFNKKYQTVAGYPNLGRILNIGVKFTL